MIYRAKTVLIISEDVAFVDRCVRVCKDNGMQPTVHDEWNIANKIAHGVVLCDWTRAGSIHSDYAKKTVIVLDDGHSYKGYCREFGTFIFDRKNEDEIEHALLFHYGEPCIPKDKCSVSAIVQMAGRSEFCGFDCDFDFAQGRYVYAGKQVYFTEAQKRALARFLLLGENSTYTRVNICRIRRAVGKAFLRESAEEEQ